MPNMTVKLTNEELKALGRVAYASGPNKDIPYTEYVHYEAAEKAVIGTDGVLLRFEKVDLGDTDFYIKADEIPAPKGKATESREVPVAGRTGSTSCGWRNLPSAVNRKNGTDRSP